MYLNSEYESSNPGDKCFDQPGIFSCRKSKKNIDIWKSKIFENSGGGPKRRPRQLPRPILERFWWVFGCFYAGFELILSSISGLVFCCGVGLLLCCFVCLLAFRFVYTHVCIVIRAVSFLYLYPRGPFLVHRRIRTV